jgi:hypothetical protein
VGLKRLLSGLQHEPEPLIDRRGDAGGHLRGGVPVVGAHDAAHCWPARLVASCPVTLSMTLAGRTSSASAAPVLSGKAAPWRGPDHRRYGASAVIDTGSGASYRPSDGAPWG